MMKKLSFLVLSSVILFSACKKDSSDPGPNPSKARVMFAHTTVGADTLRVQLNGTALTSVSALSFLSASNYVEVDPGSTRVAFTLANAGNVVLDSVTSNFTVNNAYSVFATGVVVNPSIFVTSDDLTPPPTGMAKVRLINLSPDNLNESFYVGANKLDSNVSYQEATPFYNVSASTYKVQALPQPNNSHLGVSLDNQALAVGKIYTFIVYGAELGSGVSKLNLKMITNN
jgi:hypothetical protein